MDNSTDSKQQRLVLVSGASSGIGAAVSKQLLAQGHSVIGLGRRADQLQSFFPEYSENITGVKLDLSDSEQLIKRVSELVKNQVKLQQPIDAFIACAGYGQFGALEQFSYQQMRELMEVNFTSHALISRILLPEFKKQQTTDIVFLGSEAALSGARNGAMYCASKFALRGFAQALRDECAKSGVRVSIVNPGMVDTPFFDGLEFAPGEDDVNYIRVDDVASAVMLMLMQPAGTVIDEINLSPLKKVMRNKKPE